MVFHFARRLVPSLYRSQLVFRRSFIAMDVMLFAGSILILWKTGVTAFSIGAICLTVMVFLVALTDYSLRLIPPSIPLVGGVIGISLSAFQPDSEVASALTGAFVGLVLFSGIAYLGRLALRKRAMGGGDIKLAVALGAFLGPLNLVMSVLLASLLAVVATIVICALRRTPLNTEVPFGPYMALAALVMYLAGPLILETYLGLLGIALH